MSGNKLPIHDLSALLAMTTVNENGCMEWGRNNPVAYLNGKPVKITRIVMSLLGRDISNPKIYVCHKCDNDKCINPAHLFMGTSSDNQQDHWNKVREGKAKRWGWGGYKSYDKPRWVSVEKILNPKGEG